jgi:hypothetical protein
VTESYAAQVSLFQQLKTGAGSRIRTDDLLITNQLLYQLSYAGIYKGKYSLVPLPRISFYTPFYTAPFDASEGVILDSTRPHRR